MKVFIAGATGVIGRPLIAQLQAANHTLVAITRSEQRAAELRGQGVTAVVCNVFQRDNLLRCVEEAHPDVVIHQLTALPKRIDPRKIKTQLAETNRLRTEGTRNLMDAALAAGAKRFIAQSIAFAYDPSGPKLKTEEDPLYITPPSSFAETIEAVRILEETALGSHDLPGIVLRYGFFYGRRTVYAADGSVAADVRRRRFPIVGRGTGVFSFIHVEDAATATIAALQRGDPGTYNIVDDEPAEVAAWLPSYAGSINSPHPMHVPRWLARVLVGPYAVYMMCDQKGASNAKAKQTFGWSPSFPTWRSGFESELRRQESRAR